MEIPLRRNESRTQNLMAALKKKSLEAHGGSLDDEKNASKDLDQ